MSDRSDSPEVDLEVIEKFRARFHNLADKVHGHELKVAELRLQVNYLLESFKGMASAAQLTAAVATIEQKLSAESKVLTLQIGHIHEDVSSIKRGIWWVIGIVIGAVILAVLAFVLKRP